MLRQGITQFKQFAGNLLLSWCSFTIRMAAILWEIYSDSAIENAFLVALLLYYLWVMISYIETIVKGECETGKTPKHTLSYFSENVAPIILQKNTHDFWEKVKGREKKPIFFLTRDETVSTSSVWADSVLEFRAKSRGMFYNSDKPHELTQSPILCLSIQK